MQYPHEALDEYYHFFERWSSNAPTTALKNTVKQMKQQYPKFKAIENDIDLWFDELLKIGDDEFVIHNVEYRLGSNLLEKKLWMRYFEFLKEKNVEVS